MERFRTAVRLAPENALVQTFVGHAYGFLLRDLDQNASMTAEAVRISPGNGICQNFHAISMVYRGRYAEAVQMAEKAVVSCRGTVAEPIARSTELFARLMAGEMDQAIRAGETSLASVTFRPTIVDLMTAYALSGRLEEGHEKLVALIHREPDLSLDRLKSPKYPIVNSAHRSMVVEAAHRLGLS